MLRKVKAGTIESRSRGGILLADLLTDSCLASFLIRPRTNGLGMASPAAGWVLLFQVVMKTTPSPTDTYTLKNMLTNPGGFSVEASISDDCRLCQVDKAN